MSANLAGAYLLGANLSSAIFDHANLNGANLGHTKLTGASFNGANLTNADLTMADFGAADLRATLIGVTSGGSTNAPQYLASGWLFVDGFLVGQGAVINGINLSGMDLSSMQLWGITALKANFSGAKLVGANLGGANLRWSDFSNTQMAGANLSTADIRDTAFAYADVSGDSFVGTNMQGADFWRARFDDHFTFPPGAGANLDRADLTGANLAEANLTKTNFHTATLTGANLNGTNLTQTNFVGATWVGADFVGATWNQTICNDSTVSTQHNGGSCVLPLDRTAPTATVTLPASAFQTTQQIVVTWVASDGAGSGVAYSDVQYESMPATGGSLGAWLPLVSKSTLRSVTLNAAAPGYRYCFEVRARDLAGNGGPWSAPRCTAIPIDDRSFVASPGWIRGVAPGWLLSTFSATTRAGATLTTASARNVYQVGVVATRCSTCGLVAIYVGSRMVGEINLYAPATTTRYLALLPRLSVRLTGPIRLVVVSAGRLVKVDAIAATAY